MKKALDNLIRFFVGGLFIFSGLVKLNDPIGTEIKMEEYFQVFSADFASFFEVFIPFALPIAMIMIVLEIVLGVAVLINYKMDFSVWMLLLIIVFFSFLTFYSAYFNKVTDCGCFGDAIPLTPWQSFSKDVILFFLIGHLFWYRHRFTPVLRALPGHVTIVATTLVSIFVGIYAINHLPYIDFRPYKIGNNIPQQMIPEEKPIIEYIHKKDGETVRSEKYLSKKDGYEYVGSEVINEDKTIAKITDYNVADQQGNDLTQETFEGVKLIIAMYDATKAKTEAMGALNSLLDNLGSAVTPMVLTATDPAVFETFRHEHQLAVAYYATDATVLKAMVRANPGLILMKNGTVLGKWHNNDIPSAAQVKALL